MIDALTFKSRRDICMRCSNWKGVCLKGHVLSAPVGCPEKQFNPVEGADFLPNVPAVNVPQAKPCCQGKSDSDVKPLSYTEAVRSLVKTLAEWRSAGYPLVDESEYRARLATCNACPGGHYKHYQCKLCKCVMLVKAKLRTTTCDAGHWVSS